MTRPRMRLLRPSRNPLEAGRVSVKEFAAEQRKKIEAVGPSGIHSGPIEEDNNSNERQFLR